MGCQCGCGAAGRRGHKAEGGAPLASVLCTRVPSSVGRLMDVRFRLLSAAASAPGGSVATSSCEGAGDGAALRSSAWSIRRRLRLPPSAAATSAADDAGLAWHGKNSRRRHAAASMPDLLPPAAITAAVAAARAFGVGSGGGGGGARRRQERAASHSR